MKRVDREDVRRANPLQEVIPALTGHPLVGGNEERRTRCPFHEDQHPSLRVNTTKQTWYCDPCDTGGDVFAFVERQQQTDFAGALRWLAERVGMHDDLTSPKAAQIVAVFNYCDASGQLVYQSCRKEPGPRGRKKTFVQRRPNGQGGWIYNLQAVDPLLYRLPELPGQEAVFIPEGEAKVDQLWGMALAACGESRSTSPILLAKGSTGSSAALTLWRMTMGTRDPEQPPLWIATSDLPVSPGHPFYTRLNALLDADSTRS